MNCQSLQQQISLVAYIQTYIGSLTNSRINHLINQEYYLQSASLIYAPDIHEKSHQQDLANKILAILAAQSNQPQSIISKLQYRLEVMLNQNGNIIQEIIDRYEQEKDRIRQSGLKISQFNDIYESEPLNSADETKLSKKLRNMFQGEDQMGLDELLSCSVKQLELQLQNEVDDASDGERSQQTIQQDIKFDLDKLVEEFEFIGRIFTF